MTLYVHCTIIHCGQDMGTTKASFDRRLNKEGVAHTHNGYYSAKKKKDEIIPCDNMHGP